MSEIQMDAMEGGVRGRLALEEGDISHMAVEAIVNAANHSLLGGGGVDGAIHRAAGPALLEECRRLGGCETGNAKITQGYRLPAPRVIHTVGPIWRGGRHGEDELLAKCYRNTLALARAHKIHTLAFPSISTGAYRFPIQRASRIALREIQYALENHDLPAKVTVVCFNHHDLLTYQLALREILG